MRKHIVTWRKHEFFIFPSTSSYLNVHGNTRSRSGNTFFSCFRRRNQTECRWKYWVTFRKQIFVSFLLTNSDLEWTETLDFVPETLFFLVSSIYRTLSVLVIRDLPFSLQDRLICSDRAVLYNPYQTFIPYVCEIYAPLCTITHIQELYFLYRFNQFILFFFFSSIDRPVTIFIIHSLVVLVI